MRKNCDVKLNFKRVEEKNYRIAFQMARAAKEIALTPEVHRIWEGNNEENNS